jgi:urea transport system permease protein
MSVRWLKPVLLGLWLLCLLCTALGSRALTREQALALVKGENDERITALTASLTRGDEGLAKYLQSVLDDEVKFTADAAFVVRDGKAHDAATGAEVPLPAGAEEVINSNQIRREIEGTLAALKLFSADLAERRAAIKALK